MLETMIEAGIYLPSGIIDIISDRMYVIVTTPGLLSVMWSRNTVSTVQHCEL